jgi:hypothetical protein
MMTPHTAEWTRDDYAIGADRGRLDLDVIHGFLSRSYWAEGRGRDRVQAGLIERCPNL